MVIPRERERFASQALEPVTIVLYGNNTTLRGEKMLLKILSIFGLYT